MDSIKYEKIDIINLIKFNIVELCGGNTDDYYVNLRKDNAKVTRKDRKPLKILIK